MHNIAPQIGIDILEENLSEEGNSYLANLENYRNNASEITESNQPKKLILYKEDARHNHIWSVLSQNKIAYRRWFNLCMDRVFAADEL